MQICTANCCEMCDKTLSLGMIGLGVRRWVDFIGGLFSATRDMQEVWPITWRLNYAEGGCLLDQSNEDSKFGYSIV